jgi:hypothetical protein
MTKRERLIDEWTEFLSHPSVEHSLNVRLELTMKQRRNSELETPRPRGEDINVRVPGRRFALRDAPLFAPFYYLTEDETRRIAIRVMNRLNRELFGTATRRKRAPLRLTALVCQHDKGTRRHLHFLLALPPSVSLTTFRTALSHACYHEPFIYRTSRLEHVQNLAASIRYNANDFKTLSRNSILYVHTQPEPQPENGEQPE